LTKSSTTISGDFWNFLEFSGIFWNFLEFSGNFWRFSGIFWSFLEISGDLWIFLEISGDFQMVDKMVLDEMPSRQNVKAPTLKHILFICNLTED
jgi:hypothetical protein